MKHLFSVLTLVLMPLSVLADDSTVVKSPNGALAVKLECAGLPTYSITLNDAPMLDASPLGLVANFGDFSRGMKVTGCKVDTVADTYAMNRSKASSMSYKATHLVWSLENADKQQIHVEFMVTDNDVAFRYFLPKDGETGSVRVMDEATGFRLPEGTTTFICPQSEAMIGWKRTKPSYEEDYVIEAPMDQKSQFGHGYTFPCLFHVNAPTEGWVLISETGVDSHYCGSRLSDYQNGMYKLEFPMPEEFNGNGTIEPAFALPGATPWRTITVGNTLKPIVETTVPWNYVKPLYDASADYQFGRGTWSWIVWQDGSINYEDQVKYIDFSAAMGYEYVLIDNWWDTNIGHERMEDLIKYAHSKNVDVFLWYSSSGYWNDIVQGPISRMDNSIVRKKEMRWMKEQGVKGIKVDFFAGDKQPTIQLYEEILSDANDNGLMVIFHGCTIPRGWERMYPNYVGSEAVLASENLYFTQRSCDMEALNTCLHPFIRNAIGCMEFGGCFLSRRIHRESDKGNYRKTTDVFELATTVLFQNPIQNFALVPDNITDAPAVCVDYMKQVPTTWDETVFIDGYPGKYVVMARRNADKWYLAAVNATGEPLKLSLDLPMFKGKEVQLYSGGNNPTVAPVKVKTKGFYKVTIPSEDGIVMVTN